MTKTGRAKRLISMCTMLTGNPGRQFSLSWFCDIFALAKSTISEDLAEIGAIMEETTGGKLISVLGAGGGVSYRPGLRGQETNDFLEKLAEKLNQPSRRMPGGFVYYSDLLFDPSTASTLGKIFAAYFDREEPTLVLTLETKGIPLALFTAYWLGVPLAVARRVNKVTEGASLSTNYMTGSGKRIETMFLSRHSIVAGDKVLIIDDFMKAGGSAQGLVQLTAEFDARVVGVGVMIATDTPGPKMISNFFPLMAVDNDLIFRVMEECR